MAEKKSVDITYPDGTERFQQNVIIAQQEYNDTTKQVKLLLFRPNAYRLPLMFETKEYKETKYFDIREFYLNKREKRFKPTRRGFILNKEEVESVIKFLIKYRKEILRYID